MESRLRSEKLAKLGLFIAVAGAFLTGHVMNSSDRSVEPHIRKPLPTRPRDHPDVLSDDYSNGIRVVTLEMGGARELLTQVVQLCHDGDRIGQAKYIRTYGEDRYYAEGRLRVHRDDPACSDERITPADGLPVPTPPPPPSFMPNTPKAPSYPAVQEIAFTSI